MYWRQNRNKDRREEGSMKKYVTVLPKLLLILILAITGGVLCMTLVYMLPVTEESDHVKKSVEMLQQEGWYPNMPYVQAFSGDYGLYPDSPAFLDNYTDELMIKLATINPNGNYLQAAMGDSCARYWCGFVSVIRPALLFLDYGEMRMLNILLQLLLLGVLVLLLHNRLGKMWCFWVLSIYAFLTPYAMGMSFQYSVVFYIGILGTVALVKWEKFWSEKSRYIYLFFTLGILTAYFDFLTYPLFTWALPMIVWIAMCKTDYVREHLKLIVSAGLCWCLGYGGMWSGKWLVANRILHTDIRVLLQDKIALHSIYEGTEYTFAQTLMNNLGKWINVQVTVVLLAWTVWFVVMFVKRKGRVHVGKCIPFTIIAMGSFAWYFVMRYHTMVHASFTYRIFCTTFGAILAAYICMQDEKEESGPVSGRVSIAGLILTFVISFFIVLQCKSQFSSFNANYPPRHVLLEEGVSVSETINPTFHKIGTLTLGLEAASEEGEFFIEIYKGDKVLAQRVIPFSEVVQGGMYPVAWNLNTDEQELELYITARNCGDSYGTVYMTDEVYVLEECSEAYIDGNPAGGQLTQQLTYVALPGVKTCINYMLIALGAVMLLMADGFYTVTELRKMISGRNKADGK